MQELLPVKRTEGSVSAVMPVRFEAWEVPRTVSRSRARRKLFSAHLVSSRLVR